MKLLILAAAKAAELEAQKARDIAYGNQISRSVQYSESQLRLEQQRAEQQRANAERQHVNEANRQLLKDKAYLRELEANSRRTNFDNR